MRYVAELADFVSALKDAVGSGIEERVAREFKRALFLFLPRCDLVALAFDTLTSEIDNGLLKAFGFKWPSRLSIPLSQASLDAISQ
ncbi:hypothetical protein ACFJGW_00795 [Burkholderiaceae bacterium UC74_6]